MRWWRHSRWSDQWSINQISLVKTAQIYRSFEELSQFISLCTYFTPLYNFDCLPHALCIYVSRQCIQPELDGWPPSLDENTSMKPVLRCCIHRPTSAPCCKWCSSVVQYYWWPIDSLGLLGGSVVKNSPAHVEDARDRFDPWVGKIPWRRDGNPLQCSCLESPMDRGAWWATVHGVAKCWTWLSMQMDSLSFLQSMSFKKKKTCQGSF